MSKPRPESVGPLRRGLRTAALGLLATMVLASVACGQKGPLVLPKAPAGAASAPSR